MINKLRKIIRTRGFTLIETLVAVFILTTSIAAPLTIASRALTTALISKDQVTAYYLAQDAVEYIRAKRDTACLSDTSPCSSAVWLSTVAACQGANGCYLDSTENSPASPQACTNGTGAAGPCIQATFTSSRFLCYDSANYRFTYVNGVATCAGAAGIAKSIFARSVLITSVNAAEARITVTVSWADGGYVTRSVVVTENLFNWQ